MSNCEECRFHWNNSCKLARTNGDCYICDNFDNDLLECKCTKWIDEEDNCPYFEEYYGGDDEGKTIF